jgi:hypothetical protein
MVVVVVAYEMWWEEALPFVVVVAVVVCAARRLSHARANDTRAFPANPKKQTTYRLGEHPVLQAYCRGVQETCLEAHYLVMQGCACEVSRGERGGVFDSRERRKACGTLADDLSPPLPTRQPSPNRRRTSTCTSRASRSRPRPRT